MYCHNVQWHILAYHEPPYRRRLVGATKISRIYFIPTLQVRIIIVVLDKDLQKSVIMGHILQCTIIVVA
jgi:hypothetical protein